MARNLAEAPVYAMDVGAAGGIAEHWREYLPYMEIDCFEPDYVECAALQNASPANVHWFPVALAGASESRKFYVLNRATGSSLFPPNDAIILEYSGRSYAGIRRVDDVACLSLHDFLEEHRRPAPVLMKLDTQGSELEILSSLTADQLAQLLCVEVEVEFLELYKGQPLFSDVHAFMRRSGFRLLDLRTHRSYRNAGGQAGHYLRKHFNTTSGTAAFSAELVAGDALYFREPALTEAASSKESLIKSLFILRMYRFYDLALWLVDRAVHGGLIPPGERAALVDDLVYGVPRPKLRHRADLAGQISRRILWVLARDDHEVFWTRRSWPDQ